MNLKSLLIKEHSKKQCNKIVKWIGDDVEKFEQLMKLFFGGEYIITQRAAWPLSYCVMEHSFLVKPYLKKLLINLEKQGLHPAVTRNTLRLLQYVEISKQLEGKVMSLCFNYVQDITLPVAIKAFALTVLERLSEKYPEIKPELKTIIKDRWDAESAAFRSRAKRILIS